MVEKGVPGGVCGQCDMSHFFKAKLGAGICDKQYKLSELGQM